MSRESTEFEALIASSEEGVGTAGKAGTAGESSPRARRTGSPKTRKRLIAGGGIVAVAALVLVGANVASALAAGANYRTAPVETATVEETVSANGAIASASRFDLAFQAEGTVASVDVAVGDEVTAGQKLAMLDGSDLEGAVAEAAQAVTNAEQTLAEHRESQASGGSSVAASTGAASASPAASASASSTPSSASAAAVPTTGGASTGGSSGGGGGAAAAVDPAISAAMQRVVDAQAAMLAKHQEVLGAIDSANAVVASASDSCRVFLEATLHTDSDGSGAAEAAGAEGSAGADGADDGAALATDPATEAGMSLAEAQAALAACQTEIADVQAGQASVSIGQQEVQDLAAALNAAVDGLREALEASGASSGADPSAEGAGTASGSPSSASTGAAQNGDASATGETPAASSSGNSSSSSSPGGATAITAEQLLADQAQIDLAEAGLKIAQARLAFVELTSPIDGEVAAVSLAAGDSVGAGSDSAVITVLGAEGYVAEATVSLNEVGKIEVGQPVAAVAASTGKRYSGEVSMVGVLDVSSTGTPAFTATVVLDAGEDRLLNGGSARLTIATATVENALTVPSSAVHRSGGSATVNVLRDGESRAVEVEIGAVGAERTEILSGLEAGEQVVLADLAAAISTGEETSESTGLSGLGGASSSGPVQGSFPGGETPGAPGGGFPGE